MDAQDIENNKSLEEIKAIAADNARKVAAEIAATASTIAGYDEFEFSGEEHLYNQIAAAVDKKKMSSQQKLDDTIPLLKRLRIRYLKQVASFYEKENPTEKDLAAFETNLANLEKLPPVDFFESLVSKAKSDYQELQTAQDSVLDETEKVVQAALNQQVKNVFEQAFESHLDVVKSFIGRPTDRLPPDFTKTLTLISANVQRVNNVVEASATRREIDLAKYKSEIEEAEQQKQDSEKNLQIARDKDEKPIGRRFLRFVTGGRFPKKADLKDLEQEVEKSSSKLQTAKNNLLTGEARLKNLQTQHEQSLKALKKSHKVTSDLAKTFEETSVAKDSALEEARDFCSVLRNNSAFKSKIKQDKEGEQERQSSQEKRASLGDTIAANLQKRATVAALVEEGSVLPKETKTAKAIAAAQTAVEYIPVPIAAQVLQAALLAASFVNDKKNELATKRIAAFAANPNSQKIMQKLSARLADDFSSLVIAEASKEDFAKTVGRKVMQGIGSGDIKITDATNPKDAVDLVMQYLQKQRNVVGKTEIEVEGGKEGAKYTVEGYLSRQGVQVFDSKANENVILAPKNRQDLKYGVRLATPEEQDLYNKNGKISGFTQYKPEKDFDALSIQSEDSGVEVDAISINSQSSIRSADSGYDDEQDSPKRPPILSEEKEQKLSKILEGAKLKQGVTKAGALENIASFIKAEVDAARNHKSFDKKGEDLDQRLKDEMSKSVVVGSRNFANVADKDRRAFNKIKDEVAAMIGDMKKEKPSVAESILAQRGRDSVNKGSAISV